MLNAAVRYEFLRHEQIYQSDVFGSEWQSEAAYRFALPLIVLMSLRPAIPRRVALLHCSLPLHRTFAIVNGVAGNVCGVPGQCEMGAGI